MSEQRQEEKRDALERRGGGDRRTGKLDEKFRHSVSVGFFLDMRKGDRRRMIESPVSFN